MENLNGHEAGNGGYSQGDTYRRYRPPLLGALGQGRRVRKSKTKSAPVHLPPALPTPVATTVAAAPMPTSATVRQDLLLDGNGAEGRQSAPQALRRRPEGRLAVGASYHVGCQERFVHITAVRIDAELVRHR